MAANVDNNMDVEVFDDVAITTHLFMGSIKSGPDSLSDYF
jgi:hypothetical protein